MPSPSPVVGLITTPSASFTRPADTTAYALGDLVANSTTAGSVAPLTFSPVVSNGAGMIRRVRLNKSTNTTTNATFRIHFYTQSPTVSNGDNGAWLTPVAGYIGSVDVTISKAFSDPSAQDVGVPTNGNELNFALTGTNTTIYALIEARAAYTPGSAEVFTVIPEIHQY